MKETWREYIFADGTQIIVRKFSASELRNEERKHGKCVSVRIVA